MPTLTALTVEHLTAPIGLATARPRFSWVITADEPNLRQAGYELEVRTGDEVVLATGRVEGDQSVLADPLSSDLESATGYTWRVRVWLDGSEGPTPWAESSFETSLLHGEWTPVWVEPMQQPVTQDGAADITTLFGPQPDRGPAEKRLHAAPRLRQRFTLAGDVRRARLRATAQGVYAAELNGMAVGDEVLAPGYESYHQQLSFQTYDVTDLVRAGENVLGVQLGDGWWAGRIAITGQSRQYGDLLRATWRLEIDYADGTSEVIEPSSDVVSSLDGPIRYSDIFIGEKYDARLDQPGWSAPGNATEQWTPVRVVVVGTPVVPFVGEPVRRVLELPAVEVLTTPAGETVVDFGQVIAGRVRLSVHAAEPGTEITLEHGEVLDEHGNYLNNIQGPNKDQTDVYVCAGGEESWEPLFTFHGFRYCRLTGYPGAATAEDFTAIVITSDLRATSSFTSSDSRLNRLHSNTVWSQRGNLLAVPTDCPQRERVGWTGDIQVFAPTAATNAGVAGFMQRWLGNLRRDQTEFDGTVPIIAPLPPGFGFHLSEDVDRTTEEIFAIAAAAGWGDAITIVPTVLWQRYGDIGFLRDNYAAMADWVDVQMREATEITPKRFQGVSLSDEQRERQALLWNGPFNFGDWLTPSLTDAADHESILQAPRRTHGVMGALFHLHSLDLLARAAAVLGRDADHVRYSERAALVRQAFAAEYLDGAGKLEHELQGPYVVALAFDAVPAEQKPAAVAELVRLIHVNGDRLDTGFLSVPYLLDVLWESGERDLARTLLWQDACPSWLYEVDRGATTIWEAWDAIRPDGRVGMMSFNHYAFGCVDDWMFRRLAGLQVGEPGFRTSVIAPDLDAPLQFVEAHIDTPYGRLGSRWERAGDDVRLAVEVPANTTCEVRVPSGWTTADERVLGSGRHVMTATRAHM